MALVKTPDGRSVYVPDFLAPAAPMFMPPEPPPPRAPDPIPFDQAEADAMGREGTGAPEYSGGTMRNPQTGLPMFPTPQNLPPPRTDAARIGPTVGAGQETAAPRGPSLADQIDALAPGAAPLEPDAISGADLAQPPGAPTPMPLTKAAQAAQKRQAAFQATPEGRIQAAGEGAAQAQEERGAIAEATGQIEGQELDGIAALKNEALDRSTKVASDMDAQIAERQKATAAKVADFERLNQQELDYKVDDNRRWKQMGTGKQIGFWIMTALSGLGDVLARKPIGELMPLKMMQQAIAQDVDAQIRDHETLSKRVGFARSSIDTYRQATGDLQEARKLKIAEEYDRTAREIDAMASKYASPKAKLRAQDMSAQFRQGAQQLRGATAEGIIQRDVTRAQLANQQQQTRISGGHLALANKQFKEGIRQFDKRLMLDAAQLDAAAGAAGAAGNAKAAEQMRELGVAAPPTVERDADGNVVGINRNSGALLQADGRTPWLIPTKDEAIKFRKEKAAADSLVDILDEIRGIRNRVGGETSWGNSPEYKRLMVLKENLVGLKKGGMEGMSSDADMARIEKMLGADSPASFRSQAAGLDEGREQVIKQLNTRASNLNYSGAPITYADPTKFSPELQAEDIAFKDSLRATPAPRLGQQLATEAKPDAGSPYAKDIEAVYTFKTEGTTKAQRKVIQDNVDKLSDTKLSQAQRDAARVRLEQGAQQGQTEQIRDAYRSALMGAMNSDIKGSGPLE
jgi:hypothetical protein